MAKNFDNYNHLLRDGVVILLKLHRTKKLFPAVFKSTFPLLQYFRIRTVGLWKGYGFTKVATLGVTRGGKTL